LANHYILNNGLFLGFAIAVINSGPTTSHEAIQEILCFVAVPLKETVLTSFAVVFVYP
jgi:hypothetical protein